VAGPATKQGRRCPLTQRARRRSTKLRAYTSEATRPRYRFSVVPLDVCSDLSAANWIVASHIPWKRLVTIGPGGFSAYVRVRFIPDPTHVGQRENEADLDGSPNEIEQWRAMLQLLSEETADPDDCYFGLWDGWGFPEPARRWPTFAVMDSGAFSVRAYYLFHGSLSDVEISGTPAHAGIWSRPEFASGGTPAFVWPADRTWCITADVDPHWAGIGASKPTIDRLIADHRIDAVRTDPADDQPFYR
jgi:hypothetical protein